MAKPDLKDLVTHRQSWRVAIEYMISTGDDVEYWGHELEVFDRTFGLLTQPPSPVIVTRAQALAAALRGEGCLGKAADDEPVYILRAQDVHAADLVEKEVIWMGAGNTPEGKIENARVVMEAMREWPIHKQPD